MIATTIIQSLLDLANSSFVAPPTAAVPPTIVVDLSKIAAGLRSTPANIPTVASAQRGFPARATLPRRLP
jgi:hypothetical protein